MKENLLTLYNQFRSPLLESFVSPKDFLSESMVRKITSKKKTDILNDNDFQIKFEDFKSMNRYIEEESGSYGIESFKEEMILIISDIGDIIRLFFHLLASKSIVILTNLETLSDYGLPILMDI